MKVTAVVPKEHDCSVLRMKCLLYFCFEMLLIITSYININFIYLSVDDEKKVILAVEAQCN